MSQEHNPEKQLASAPPISAQPPSYSSLYPSDKPETPQYGFYAPSPPNLGYQGPHYQPGYPSQPQPQPYQPGYFPPQPPAQTPVHPTIVNQPIVVVPGGCPTCRVGMLEDDYTCLGILCAICCFPFGILFCLATKEKRCTNCRSSFNK